VDLFLTPLERMSDYKRFLDQLYEWGDTSQKADYEFLGKAARRIGRIADHIERYRYGIYNRNELNKVQTFVGKQFDILTPNRRIVRRGMIIRRTTGWAARNKYYIFFLFNDSLLWTNRKGELQNVVLLRHCQLYPSDAKRDANRKFKIVVQNLQRRKILLLDCLSIRQRNDWYNALEKTMAEVRTSSDEAWSKEVLPFNDKDSDEEVTPAPQNLMLPTKSPKPHNDDDDNSSVATDLSYDERYENSFNFDNEDFKEIPQMEEAVSEISEYDQDFLEKYQRYQEAKNDSGATAALISPFLNTETPGIIPDESGDLCKRDSEQTERESFSSSGGIDQPVLAPGPRRSSIIRRKRDSIEDTVRLRRSSSLNISLCDEKLLPSPHNDLDIGSSYAIRLNDCEK